jgi:hypothetical protein
MGAGPGNAWRRLWAASGVLTVALFACGLLFGDVLGTSNFPALDASASDLRRESGAPAGLAALALAGGAMAAGFLLLSALRYRTLAEPTVARDAPLAHALLVLSYLAGGPAIAVPLAPMVGVVAAATLREHILARWTGWLGVVTAPMWSSLCEHPPRPNEQPLGHVRHPPAGRRAHVRLAHRHEHRPPRARAS